MTIEIANVLLAFAVLGYVSFVFEDDQWKRTFYSLVIANIIVAHADVPVWITYLTTAAVAVFFIAMLWQSRHHSTTDGFPIDRDAKRAAAKAKLAEAKRSGDYSKLSDADVKDAGLVVIETAEDTIQLFPGSVTVVEVEADGTTRVDACIVQRGRSIYTALDDARISYERVAP